MTTLYTVLTMLSQTRRFCSVKGIPRARGREALAKIDTIDIISNKDLSQVEGDASVGDVILLFVRFGSVQLLDQYTLR